MTQRLTRRSFALASAAALAAPAVLRHARADEPVRLRLSLDTAPSHLPTSRCATISPSSRRPRAARSSPRSSRAASSTPDLEVGKALIQGQVEMAAPGSWTITGIVSDADCFQLPGASTASRS